MKKEKPLHIAFVCFTFVFLFFVNDLFAKKKAEPFIIMSCRETSGMFSAFDDVLGLLDCYENGYLAGVHVNFSTHGLYYDSKYGPNWWTYYCDPIFLGKKKNAHVKEVQGIRKVPNAIKYEDLRFFGREKAFKLIKKYIHFKPYLLEKVKNFVSEHFQSHYIIGVHYRGTDKIKEAPRVPYDQVIKEIKTLIDKQQLSDYKIFVATDEQDFLDYVCQLFPDKTCFYEGMTRSNDHLPIHQMRKDQHKLGEEAILDCLLLSKTNFLIRTSSNLSLWSTYFNPKLPSLELNKRYRL